MEIEPNDGDILMLRKNLFVGLGPDCVGSDRSEGARAETSRRASFNVPLLVCTGSPMVSAISAKKQIARNILLPVMES